MGNPFQILRDAIKRREPYWGAGGKVPIAFRFMELAGEAGEAANAGKKLARHELGMVGGSDDLTNLKEELGDVIICCELIAGHYGIDLWQAVVDKFNKTSEKHGMPVKITDKLQSRPKEPDIVSGSRPSAVPGCKCEDCKIARARKTRTG